jgi:flagellar hook assembly protein FlgD
MGREIKSFSIIAQPAGYQNIVWNTTDQNGNPVSSGLYLYKLNAKSLENEEVFVKSAKMVVLK